MKREKEELQQQLKEEKRKRLELTMLCQGFITDFSTTSKNAIKPQPRSPRRKSDTLTTTLSSPTSILSYPNTSSRVSDNISSYSSSNSRITKKSNFRSFEKSYDNIQSLPKVSKIPQNNPNFDSL